jgi:hypothetical protein
MLDRRSSGLRGLVENLAHLGREIASAVWLAQEVVDRIRALMLVFERALDGAVGIS